MYRFSLDGNFENCLRISFSFYNPNTLQSAVKKLVAVIQNHLQNM